MTTTTFGEPRRLHTSNTTLYWGLGITAAVLVTLALMRPSNEIITPDSNQVIAQETMQVVDPATGQAYRVDPATGTIVMDPNSPTYDANRVNGTTDNPRANDFHNGANSTNGGIAPNVEPNNR